MKIYLPIFTFPCQIGIFFPSLADILFLYMRLEIEKLNISIQNQAVYTDAKVKRHFFYELTSYYIWFKKMSSI